MASLPNDTVVRHYVTSLCNGGLATRPRGGSVEISKAGELIYHRRGGYRRTDWGPAVLAHYSDRQQLFVLNGDGLTDGSATRWQAFLRRTVQQAVRNENVSRGRRYVLVPYAALTAAGIDLDSIKPIDVTEDTWENIWHPIPDPPDLSETPVPERGQLPKGWEEQASSGSNRVFTVTVKGTRFRVTSQHTHTWTHRVTGRKYHYHPIHGNVKNEYEYSDKVTFVKQMSVWGTPELGQGGWQVIRRYAQWTPPPQEQRTVPEVEPHPDSFGWIERRHNLGASVFSAKNGTSRRRRFLSAFDELERANTMYFLAQLPDGPTVASYQDAVQALAPPIVKAAWSAGTQVYRQGDVFAIATNLTDEQVYSKAIRRVRRQIVLTDRSPASLAQKIVRGEPLFPIPDPKEVREHILCICGCGHKRWVGHGPKAQRTLSIYRTGHTATEVVVTADGTFGRGMMHHDPQIEDATRRREHVDVSLGTDPKTWFLFVRNTVPRRKPQRQEGGT